MLALIRAGCTDATDASRCLITTDHLNRAYLSVGVPNAAQLDADGWVKQRDGKRQYTAVLSFESAEAREHWQRMILAALTEAGVGESAP